MNGRTVVGRIARSYGCWTRTSTTIVRCCSRTQGTAMIVARSHLSTSEMSALDSPEAQRFREKLRNSFELTAEQINFASLKYCTSDAIKESSEDLDVKLQLIRQHLSTPEIGFNLQILTLTAGDLRERIDVLKELGFVKIEVKLLNSMPQLMTKTIAELREHSFLSSDCPNPVSQIVDSLISANLLKAECRRTIEADLPRLINECRHSPLSTIRAKTLVLVLRSLLNSSEPVATHMVDMFQEARNFDHVSFRRLVTVLNVFIDEIKLPINQLIKNFTAFINYEPENLKKLAQIEDFRQNTTLRNLFFTRQRLLQTDADAIERRVQLLRSHYKCSIVQLENCISILELSEQEIKDKFQRFNATKSFGCFGQSNQLLRLVSNVDLALNNLNKLNEKDISTKYVSLQNLLISNNKFVAMVKNYNFKLSLNAFTQLHFDSNAKDVKTRIGALKLPRKKNLNSINAERVVSFFREQNLTDEQILNGIYLVYCQLDSIKAVWELMFPSSDDGSLSQLIPESSTVKIDDWRQHPLVLHLVYYFLEKQHKF